MSQPSLDLDFDGDDGGLPTFGVGELVAEINAALRKAFYEGVWVRGEVQGWRETSAGHAYFNLVEETDQGKATIAVSWFANSRARLRPLLAKHRLRIGDGMKVRIHGFVDLYGPTGRLGLKMAGIDPRYTLGELALQRDDVVRRLVASGLFDRNRSLPLPLVPLRVGVVSSIGTAAWHDFTHELEASGIGFELSVVDVRVQGEWAVGMVSEALRTLGAGRRVDVVVVIRGGGARTDLATFDAEEIAMAIAMCPVPVFTGLGHEIDRSVADEVAHLSLKTPTACAAALVERVRAFADRTDRAWVAVGRHTATACARADGSLARTWDRAAAAARLQLERSSARLDALQARAEALDPALAMRRGWSITRTLDGAVLRSAGAVSAGTVLVTTLADGDVHSQVVDRAQEDR